MKKLAALLFFFACTTVYAQPVKTTVYKSTQYKCSISYPNNWKLDDTRDGAAFFIFSPKENDDDRFIENINLISRDITGSNISFKEYIKLNTDQIETALTDFKKESERYFKIGNNNAFEVVYSGKIKNVDYRLKWVQRYILKGNVSYIITYSADAEKTDKYLAAAKKIINGLKLL
jgi:eukaryotic-like serine/threonine-protein kinase